MNTEQTSTLNIKEYELQNTNDNFFIIRLVINNIIYFWILPYGVDIAIALYMVWNGCTYKILRRMINPQDLMQAAYCSNVSILELTNELCKKAIEENIPGDFAEAGVAMGVHPIIMGQYNRTVHLFDSFEGICTHGDNDKEFTEAYGKGENDERKTSGITGCSLPGVQNHILNYHDSLENFRFHQGWYIDTLPYLKDESFSVLRLDCDLYSSYKLCFEHLWPRLNKGGFLIIDDYTLSGCQKAIKECLPKKYHNKFTQINEIAYLKK